MLEYTYAWHFEHKRAGVGGFLDDFNDAQRVIGHGRSELYPFKSRGLFYQIVIASAEKMNGASYLSLRTGMGQL